MLVWIYLYLILIINTLIPDALHKMIDDSIEQRKENFIKKRNLTIKILSEYFRCIQTRKNCQVFLFSAIVLKQKGRLHQLVRNTQKTRRMKKEERGDRQDRIQQWGIQKSDLREKIYYSLVERKGLNIWLLKIENEKNSQILTDLFNRGIIEES